MEEKSAAVVTSSNGKIRVIRASILGLLIIIFIGYIFMWIMLPTSTYRSHFYPKINDHTKSTFFGEAGAAILVFTFPMLFISVLGSVYLHLGLKYKDDNSCKIKRKSILSSWKRPMIVKGLGIVSWIEIFILVMFIALLVWTFSTYLHYFFDIMDLFKESENEKRWKSTLSIIGFTFGIIGNLTACFISSTGLSPIVYYPRFGLLEA